MTFKKCMPELHKLQRVNWNDLRIVASIIVNGSIRVTAQKMFITESTVSRALKRLETNLETNLFYRTSTGLRPTKACNRLAPHLKNANNEIQKGLEEILGLNTLTKGEIRLAAVPAVANHILVPELEKFVTKYPDIHLSLIANPQYLSIEKCDIDIAILMSRPTNGMSVVTKKVGILKYGVYISAKKAASSASVPWVTYEEMMEKEVPQAPWIHRICLKNGEPLSSIRVNDADTLIEMIKLGMGKSLLPSLIGGKQSDLMELSGYMEIPLREVWVAINPNIHRTKRASIVINWIKQVFSKTA